MARKCQRAAGPESCGLMGHPEPDQADAGTHTVIASFVVFILGLYMNGEFWQEGTL